MWEDYSDFVSNFRDDLEEPYINCSQLAFSKMFTTGSLGDYLGMPTRKSYFASSTKASSGFSFCSDAKKIALVNSSYSWDSIISHLRYNGQYVDIPGVTCSSQYDNSSTVVLKASSIMKIQSYHNANFTFDPINNVNRDHVSHGLLVGISPANSVVS